MKESIEIPQAIVEEDGASELISSILADYERHALAVMCPGMCCTEFR
jgi:hypothetical protein